MIIKHFFKNGQRGIKKRCLRSKMFVYLTMATFLKIIEGQTTAGLEPIFVLPSV